jgi:hypothetical protein
MAQNPSPNPGLKPHYFGKLRGYQFWLTLLEVLVFIAVPFYGIGEYPDWSLIPTTLEGLFWPFFCVNLRCFPECVCVMFLTDELLGLLFWGAIIIPIALEGAAAGLAKKARMEGTSLVPTLVLTLGGVICFGGVILYLCFSTLYNLHIFSFSVFLLSPWVLMFPIGTQIALALIEFARRNKTDELPDKDMTFV